MDQETLEALLASSVGDLKKGFPDVRAVFACGSAITRPELRSKSDIDLIALMPRSEPSNTAEVQLPADEGRFVDVAIYDPLYFEAIARDPRLFFYSLRDVRKLLSGRLLFDTNGQGASVVARLQGTEVEPGLVKPIFQQAIKLWESGSSLGCFSFDAARGLELFVFGLMHSRRDIAYSKHKYLLADAERFGAPLYELLADIAAITVARRDIDTSLATFAAAASDPASAQYFEGVQKVVLDAATLVAGGAQDAAVFPLRYLSIVIHNRGCRRGALSEAIDHTLLVNCPIPARVHELFHELVAGLNEFG